MPPAPTPCWDRDGGAALAVGLGEAERRDGVAAGVDRRGDRGHHLVAAQHDPNGPRWCCHRPPLPPFFTEAPPLHPANASPKTATALPQTLTGAVIGATTWLPASTPERPGGPVAARAGAVLGVVHRGAARAPGLRVAHRVAAGGDGQADRGDDLVATARRRNGRQCRYRSSPGGAARSCSRGGRARRWSRSNRPCTRRTPAEGRHRVAADVDRRADRRDHLVAAEHASPCRRYGCRPRQARVSRTEAPPLQPAVASPKIATALPQALIGALIGAVTWLPPSTL